MAARKNQGSSNTGGTPTQRRARRSNGGNPSPAQQLLKDWTSFGQQLTKMTEQYQQLGVQLGAITAQETQPQQAPAAAPAIPQTGVAPVRRRSAQAKAA